MLFFIQSLFSFIYLSNQRILQSAKHKQINQLNPKYFILIYEGLQLWCIEITVYSTIMNRETIALLFKVSVTGPHNCTPPPSKMF